MPDQSVTGFRDEFASRTKKARDAAGFTQEEIADLLGIAQGTYKNYETIRPLPHEYVRRFCVLCRVEIEWLYNGKAPKKPKLPKGSASVTRLRSKKSD